MPKFLFFIIPIFSLTITSSLFALWEDCDADSYECYRDTTLKNYCQDPSQVWNKSPNFWAITDAYAAFESSAQNSQIQKVIAGETNTEEKARLQKDLSLSRIGAFDGFRAVEIARVQYRNNMNRIFSCAVIAGRYEKISKITKLIEEKFPGKASDIKKKLEKETKRYEQLMTKMNCWLNNEWEEEKPIKIIDRLASSAAIEYCSYTYYLDYLGASVKKNLTKAQEIESKIGDRNTSRLATTTESALSVITSRQNAIEREIGRARDTLPKALIAYREMERTYGAHLLLIMIFDDYIRLRDNISNYLSAVSQLFEKAYNAQDKNAR